MRAVTTALCLWLSAVGAASAEVVKVAVLSRAPVAHGHAFGKTGAYERLTGTIEFAIEPSNPRNARIAELARAPRAEDGRVRFTSSFEVLQPLNPALGNGVLLFDIANRGRKTALGVFNRAPARTDPTAPGDFGDGFLMREGYTVVYVRIYLIAGSQHGPAAFPPPRGAGEQPANPVPHAEVMRALLRALHRWTASGVEPPVSRHPTLADRTLVRVSDLRFPAIPGVAAPQTIVGPAIAVDGRVRPLPFLVPQVDGDGNEIAGIRLPEVAVPLATATGWNFRSAAAGNATDIVALLGAYMPFANTRAERDANGDPRQPIDARYRTLDDYLARVRRVVADLVDRRYVLEEDVDAMMSRAAAQWEHATKGVTVSHPGVN